MDEQKPVSSFDESWPPELPHLPPFRAGWREILSAVLMFALAYLYLLAGEMTDTRCMVYWTVFTLGFVGLTELLHWEQMRLKESWLWLACVGMILIGLVSGRCRVWSQNQAFLFLHVFAVYWAVSRSGRLLEGKSSHLLPLDGLFAFVVYPFKHFFLRIRCIWYALSHLRRGERKLGLDAVLALCIAVPVAFGLFVWVVELLAAADSGFAGLTERVRELFRWEPDDWTVLRLLFSLPVGAYLFGLIAGTAREEPARLQEKGRRITGALEQLHRIPAAFWNVVGGLFAAVYLVFFVFQASYLFGAFTRTLPEGFIVSEYARQGFFELCKVSAINFFLLWLMVRSGSAPVRSRPTSRIVCAVLLVQNALLAVVALSKLGLYISCFGFTPLRLQSTWLAAVLLAGCICALYTLLTGRKTLRVWMAFGALSLSALHLY